ncbi:uncharacterized protein B0P05DRAFT_555252 [Gilbertella persicaria]|uniref:uncharacterized protein n=1 Tax=Gilbertella persicaria TaxID=101096 RepID=UPI002220CDC1|nr:uncharacterized protein B0P05DRAFT_555252 [Gilbertella persicaria]KAI8063682.1 hypothetical protein B0P05DRAFT_555252 [Gilbertella persicaria]
MTNPSSWLYPFTYSLQTTSGDNKEQDNTNSVWSWLGYSNTAEPDKQTPKETIEEIPEDTLEETPEDISVKKPFYWNYLFSNSTSKNEPDSIEEKSKMKQNVVLPTFEQQEEQQPPSFLSKAVQAIHSFLSTTPDALLHKKNKNIVIIGVHGWFPMKLVRSMIGEPTGTSTKFCEQMTAALEKYFDMHNIIDAHITSIPLVWEGKVLERVEKLFSQVLEWRETIQSADLILWATHSQGTPVSTILLQRMIQDRLVTQPVCMLAMAGISHGPFPSLKGSLLVKYFEADAARELFEFMHSDSPISVTYREAMAYNLQHHVKVVLVGSMQDQVVPLYSAIMSGMSHPNILRAVYIDSHLEDDFLVRLIVFCIRLLNMGLSDHGFLIYISEVLAGNVYALEGGHSTIYEALDVFLLPLHYVFETKQVHVKARTETQKQRAIHQVEASMDPFHATTRLNPYHLPWAMRGIWDDPRIIQHAILSKELEQLQYLFEHWYPTTAKLKEIKFRLEPLKARL